MLHRTSCKLSINPLFSFTSEDNHPHLIVWSGIIRPVLTYSVLIRGWLSSPLYSPWSLGFCRSCLLLSMCLFCCPSRDLRHGALSMPVSFLTVFLFQLCLLRSLPLLPPTVSLGVVPRSRAVELFCVCQWVSITSSSCLFIQWACEALGWMNPCCTSCFGSAQ